MATVNPGRDLRVTLAPGEILTIVPTSIGAGTVYDLVTTGVALPFSAGARKLIGPFPTDREYMVSLSAGSAEVDVVQYECGYAALLANVEPFTGNRVLAADDAGKVFRCDDASGVTVTIPASLPLGFFCAVSRYGAGSVTFAAGAGMTSRSTATTIAAQYGGAEISVLKAGEYLIRGDVA